MLLSFIALNGENTLNTSKGVSTYRYAENILHANARLSIFDGIL